MVVILGFAYFFMCAILRIESPQILIAIVGAIGVVLGYFFGASSGSAKKDDTIAKMVQNTTEEPVTKE